VHANTPSPASTSAAAMTERTTRASSAADMSACCCWSISGVGSWYGREPADQSAKAVHGNTHAAVSKTSPEIKVT
jgi:hypothetical protein